MLDPKVIEEYAKRKTKVEPVFAHLTSHRKGSWFMVWGLEKSRNRVDMDEYWARSS